MSRQLIHILMLLTLLSGVTGVEAARHRATRLGHPSTRFAPPLRSAEDLRARFRNPKLKPDIAEILRQTGWPGDLRDIHRAARENEIVPQQIPVGDVMPFMSSRKGGKPIALKEVLWAGKEPIQAFAFNFESKGRRYRCITPRPCSNFFVVDKGPANTRLSLYCRSPERSFTGRTVKVCMTVRNEGPIAEPAPEVVLELPPGATVTATSDNGRHVDGRVVWQLDEIAAGAGKEVCAAVETVKPGRLVLRSSASGRHAKGEAKCASETEIIGVYSLLVEVVDLADPNRVGEEITYVITAKNQGVQPHSNLRIDIALPPNQEFVRGGGASRIAGAGKLLESAPLSRLAGKATAEWRLVTRALSTPGRNDIVDSRLVVRFQTDQITDPIREEESTQIY